MATHPTRELILDCAEHLFAAQGFHATSLRQLTAEAGVNLAAVSYHFGSKDGLIAAMFERRLEPVNRERLERFAMLVAEHDPDPVPLNALLTAFFAPALRLAAEPGGDAVLRLFGRLHNEPAESRVWELFFAQFGAMQDRFVPLLAQALPGLPRKELCWRTHFMIGAMAHTLACDHGLRLLSDGECDGRDPDESLARLVAFSAAGLGAPLPESPKEVEP